MPTIDPAHTRPVVLITGTSSGIGRASVDRFVQAGWRVAATMRDPQRSDITEGANVRVIALDVTDEASIAAGVAAAVEAFGRLDALVNNAGYALIGPVEALGTDELRRQFETNVIGLVTLTRHCLPHLRATHGTVVNIASIGGRLAFPYGAAYHGTKFAVEGISEAMRFELAPQGVRVRVVEPGGIRTDFLGRSIQWREHPDHDRAMAGFRALFDRVESRLPGPEPVADVIVAATTSRGGRLRWTAKPGVFYWVNRVLPDAVWRRLIAATLQRSSTTRRRATTAA